MSVYKVPESPFYHYRFMYNARLYKGSTGEKLPYKARMFESAKMEAVRRGDVHVGKAPRLSVFAKEFKTFVEKTAEAKQLAVKTRKYYENGCRLLETTPVWNLRIDQISAEDARTLSFPHSSSNANNALRTLRRILSYAKDRKLLYIVPEIALLEESGRDAVLSPRHESLFLEFAVSPLREIIVIMLDSFMRPDEACRMQWRDIHWSESQVFIPTGKTRKARRFVGLTDRMRNELSLRQQDDSDGQGGTKSEWVFPSKRAKSGHLMPSSLDKMWTIAALHVQMECKKRRLSPLPKGLTLYSCRHTGLTNFNAVVGGDQAKVARIAGHSDIRVTQKYLHPSITDAAELMNQHNKKARLQLVEKRA
jgi:integrase